MEHVSPTDYQHQHQLIETTASGLNVVRYPARWHILNDMGLVSPDQELALRTYELMREAVSSKPKGGAGTEYPDEYPTLRDGYWYHVMPAYKGKQTLLNIINMLTDTVQIPDRSVPEIKKALQM